MKKSIFDYMQEGTSVKPTREKIQKSKNLASASVKFKSAALLVLDAEIAWCEKNPAPYKNLSWLDRGAFKMGFIMGLKQAKLLLGKLR